MYAQSLLKLITTTKTDWRKEEGGWVAMTSLMTKLVPIKQTPSSEATPSSTFPNSFTFGPHSFPHPPEFLSFPQFSQPLLESIVSPQVKVREASLAFLKSALRRAPSQTTLEDILRRLVNTLSSPQPPHASSGLLEAVSILTNYPCYEWSSIFDITQSSLADDASTVSAITRRGKIGGPNAKERNANKLCRERQLSATSKGRAEPGVLS